MKEGLTNDELLNIYADSLDCFTEKEFQIIAGATAGTVEAWRKRRQGPDYARIGNNIFYPRQAVADYIRRVTRECESNKTCHI